MGGAGPQGASAEEGWAILRGGADLFDAGQHHASHETFEAAWLAARRGGRIGEAYWWQGLVLCAGALHHRGKGNSKGARALSQRAMDRFGTALELAGDASDASPWWVAPCEAWLRGWKRVQPESLGNDTPQAPAGTDPRLGDLLGQA